MDQLKQIVEQTNQMLNLAMTGEWERLVEMEKERRQHLMRYFAPDQLGSLPPQATRELEHIIQQDNKIKALAEEARTEVMGHLGRVKQAKQVNNAYGAA